MSYAKISIPEQELMYPGHLACAGCGASIAMRLALKALGPDTVLAIPACCWAVIDGPFPYTSVKVPLYHCAFETAAITACGIKAALRRQGKNNVEVVAWAGDGGTFDIGFQALSGAVERNEDFTYICYDNEAYMNTGIQRSSATPLRAWTTTTLPPSPKGEPKKNIVEILAAHRIPYTATATIAYPEDLIRKVKKARSIRGSKFIHIYVPCPVGHRFTENTTVEQSRLAVQTRVFPLYEVMNGREYVLNFYPEPAKPVEEYIKPQGRFKHLTDKDIKAIQATVNDEWEYLLTKIKRIETKGEYFYGKQ